MHKRSAREEAQASDIPDHFQFTMDSVFTTGTGVCLRRESRPCSKEWHPTLDHKEKVFLHFTGVDEALIVTLLSVNKNVLHLWSALILYKEAFFTSSDVKAGAHV